MDLERPEWLEQMEGILETLNEGVLIGDDCNHIVSVNSVFLEMAGIAREEMLGRSSDHFYSGEDAAFLRRQIAVGERLGQNRFEFYVPKPNGDRVPVVVSSRRVEDPDGREFAIVTFTDITEQKHAELQLKEANTQLEERQKEIEEELVLGARVQQSLAPKSLRWGRVAVEAFYHPVRTIGGYFGMVSPQEDGTLSLLLCDVSGHGISSALVANRIYTELMSQIKNAAPLGRMLEDLNRFVLHNLGSSTFYFTLVAARLEDEGRRMDFAGAGHPPAMVVKPNGISRLLDSQSMVLGLFEEAVDSAPSVRIELDRGDRVVLYTDGLTEVFNERQEMLDIDGLRKIVESTSGLPLDKMKEAILERVEAWRHGPPADDMSLVLVEIQ
jgi:sigma-B regulation protein RsbU (phosphoserine phosphatase)